MSFRDVKDYYGRLGVAPGASGAAVKRAYRDKAKRTHPDSAGGDAVAFRGIAEAYDVLGGADSRAAYDALCRQVGGLDRDARSRARRPAARQPEPSRKPEPPAARPSVDKAARPSVDKAARPSADKAARPSADKAARPSADKAARPSADKAARPSTDKIVPPVACEICGVVTAQPRFVIFHQVVGQLWRSRRVKIEGVFCRGCADRAAIKATAVTWFLGWWSVPRGPADAARALLRNLAGGEKPAGRNADLLVRQARAFADMGRADLAGDLAIQARGFRPDERLDDLIAGAGARRLKDRWRIGGLSFILQALPIGLAAAWLIVQAATLATEALRGTPALAPSQPAPASRADPPASNRAARTRFIIVGETALRDGPGSGYGVLEMLNQFDEVQVIGGPVDGGWLAVATDSGLRGFVRGEALIRSRTLP